MLRSEWTDLVYFLFANDSLKLNIRQPKDRLKNAVNHKNRVCYPKFSGLPALSFQRLSLSRISNQKNDIRNAFQ